MTTFSSAADALRFLTGSNATVTLDFEATGRHFTLKIAKPWNRDDNCRDHDAKIFFVNELTGDPNDDDFRNFVGFFFADTKKLMQSKKARAAGTPPCDAFKALAWVMRQLSADVLPEGVAIHHSDHCCRCGRTITHPDSLARGIGPECIKHFS